MSRARPCIPRSRSRSSAPIVTANPEPLRVYLEEIGVAAGIASDGARFFGRPSTAPSARDIERGAARDPGGGSVRRVAPLATTSATSVVGEADSPELETESAPRRTAAARSWSLKPRWPVAPDGRLPHAPRRDRPRRPGRPSEAASPRATAGRDSKADARPAQARASDLVLAPGRGQRLGQAARAGLRRARRPRTAAPPVPRR